MEIPQAQFHPLRNILSRYGLRAKHFSLWSGIGVQTVRLILNGTQKPTPSQQEKIAEFITKIEQEEVPRDKKEKTELGEALFRHGVTKQQFASWAQVDYHSLYRYLLTGNIPSTNIQRTEEIFLQADKIIVENNKIVYPVNTHKHLK